MRDEAADAVAHSQEEHVETDRLAAQLVDSDPTDDTFDETLRTLVAAVSHHIEEEESDVLPAVDALPRDRQQRLADAFTRTRAGHLTAGAVDLTRNELEIQARNQGVSGTSSMSKAELRRELHGSAPFGPGTAG